MNRLSKGFDYKDYKFGFDVGSRQECRTNDRWIFTNRIDEQFNLKPAVRSKIFKHLYLTGCFSDWVEGYGIVNVVDREAWEAYLKRNEITEDML